MLGSPSKCTHIHPSFKPARRQALVSRLPLRPNSPVSFHSTELAAKRCPEQVCVNWTEDMRTKSFGLLLLLSSLFLSGIEAQTPWKQSDLIQPQQAAAELRSGTNVPAVLFVGFPVLYRGAHIPSAVLAGPCSKPEGIAKLKKAVAGFSRNRKIIIYCGCCPFVKCPNVRPAYAALHDMGFSNVQVLELDTNFHTDWIEKGLPTKRGE